MALDLPDLVFTQSYTHQYLKKPPPGYIDWDKEALSSDQQHYMVEQLADIVKKNEEYIYYHPEVIALLCILLRSLAKHQPGNVRSHIKKVLKDPLLMADVNFFLLERGYKKNEDILQHDKEVELENVCIEKQYEGVKFYTECFRSELPLPKRTARIFKKTNWKEPYPDYMIKKMNTLQYTLPHFIKATKKQYYPLRPTF